MAIDNEMSMFEDRQSYYNHLPFNQAPIFSYTSSTNTSPSRVTLKRLADLIRDPKAEILPFERFLTTLELRNYYGSNCRLNVTTDRKTIAFKTDGSLKFISHVFCDTSVFPENLPTEILTKFPCSNCLKSLAVDDPKFSQQNFVEKGFSYTLRLVNMIFLQGGQGAEKDLNKMQSNLLEGVKKHSPELYEDLKNQQVHASTLDNTVNHLASEASSKKPGLIYFAEIGKVVVGLEIFNRRKESVEFVIKLEPQDQTPKRVKQKRSKNLEEFFANPSQVDLNQAMDLGDLSSDEEEDFGLDRMILDAAAKTSLPTDPSASKCLEKAEKAYRDKRSRLNNLRETFEFNLSTQKTENAKIRSILDIEKLHLAVYDNDRDIKKIRKDVLNKELEKISDARGAVARAEEINKCWKELSDRRVSCMTQKIDMSKEMDLPETNIIISRILRQLTEIEEKKSAFLQDMEQRSSELLSELDRAILGSRDDFDGQKNALAIIEKIAGVYGLDLGERTLYITESFLATQNDPTWTPNFFETDVNDTEIPLIYSGRRALPQVQNPSKKRRAQSSPPLKSGPTTDHDSLSPIINPIKRQKPQMEHCSSPFHFCDGSADENLPAANDNSFDSWEDFSDLISNLPKKPKP